MTGYRVGPTLPVGESPWPIGWEQDPRIDDGHPHDWETVLLGSDHRRVEEVVRCSHCHAPRCGHSSDPNPCMERRHHRGLHLFVDGSYEPVGGMPPAELWPVALSCSTCGHWEKGQRTHDQIADWMRRHRNPWLHPYDGTTGELASTCPRPCGTDTGDDDA